MKMTFQIFCGALVGLFQAVVLGKPVKQARIRYNSNTSGVSLQAAAVMDTVGTALGSILGAYVEMVWNQIKLPLATYLGIVNVDPVTKKPTAFNHGFTPADLANPHTFGKALETKGSVLPKLLSFVENHGAGLLTALRPATVSGAADTVLATLNSARILGNPSVNGVTVYKRIGAGQSVKQADGTIKIAGAVYEFLQAIGIKNPIDSLEIDSMEIASIDLSDATTFGSMTVTHDDPFADFVFSNTPPTPTYVALVASDPTQGVSMADVANFFAANGATTLPLKRALLATRNVNVSATANAAAIDAAALTGADKLV